MPQQAPSKSFKLPRVRWSDHGFQLLSFRRDALQALGEYLPGSGAMVVDPRTTGDKYPEAVARHEETHASLSINSAFGYFTQVLFLMAQHGLAHNVLRECFVEQWCVQELAATYDEMCFFALMSPKLLEERIRSLPSGRLDQPPYREVFDAMNRFLTVDPSKPSAVLTAQTVLVKLLALAAMNSECLLQMAAGPGTESSLLACMADSPTSRFERIMNRLIADRSLEPLLADSVTLLAQDPRLAGPTIYGRLISLVPEVSIQAEAELIPQVTRANAVYEAITGRQVQTLRVESERRAGIIDSREQEEQVIAAMPPREIPEAELGWFLAETQCGKLGLAMELAVRDSGETFMDARPYDLKPNHAPHPDEYPRKRQRGFYHLRYMYGSSDDVVYLLDGLTSARTLLGQLKAFPTLPHVAIFIDESWRNWYQVPGARERLQSCVRISRQTRLSRDMVVDNILAFEDLGNGAQVFALDVSDEQKPDSYIGYFFNPRLPLVYAMQKVSGKYGLELFSSICRDLGLAKCTEPSRVVPHFDLLNVVSWRHAV